MDIESEKFFLVLVFADFLFIGRDLSFILIAWLHGRPPARDGSSKQGQQNGAHGKWLWAISLSILVSLAVCSSSVKGQLGQAQRGARAEPTDNTPGETGE